MVSIVLNNRLSTKAIGPKEKPIKTTIPFHQTNIERIVTRKPKRLLDYNDHEKRILVSNFSGGIAHEKLVEGESIKDHGDVIKNRPSRIIGYYSNKAHQDYIEHQM